MKNVYALLRLWAKLLLFFLLLAWNLIDFDRNRFQFRKMCLFWWIFKNINNLLNGYDCDVCMRPWKWRFCWRLVSQRYGQCGLLNCDKFSKGLTFRTHIFARVELSWVLVWVQRLNARLNCYWKLMFCKLFFLPEHKFTSGLISSDIFNQSAFSIFTFVRSDWWISLAEHSNGQEYRTIQFRKGNERYLLINSLLWCFGTQMKSSTRKPFLLLLLLLLLVHSRVWCNFESKR